MNTRRQVVSCPVSNVNVEAMWDILSHTASKICPAFSRDIIGLYSTYGQVDMSAHVIFTLQYRQQHLMPYLAVRTIMYTIYGIFIVVVAVVRPPFRCRG